MTTTTPGGNVVLANETSPVTTDPVLLYDGLCGFCDGTVQFVLRRDPGGALRFAPLQGSTAAGILERHPGLRGVDSLVLVRNEGGNETAAVRSEAVLGIASYLGGAWKLTAVFRIVPRPLRDWAYALFARFRYRLFGRYDSCPVPTPDVRSRFLP